MFDIGFSELLVIAVVGLVVLGPRRLPEVARTAGQWVAKVRRFVADVKQDLDREMQHADMAELRSLKRELNDTRRVMEETSGQLLKDANIAVSPHVANEGGTAPASVAAPVGPTEPAPAPAAPAPKKKPKRATKGRKKSKKKAAPSRGAHGRA